MNPHGGQPIEWAGAPLGDSPAVVIAVHGRGASARNILDLAKRFDRPALTYAAPAAASNTWYPYTFLSPIEQNEPGISSGLEVLRQLVDTIIERGVRKDHIVLMGFSQGACLSSEFLVRNADGFGGLLAFSGGLIGPPGTAWNSPASFRQTPVFLGCGEVDSHIPKARVLESASVFERMNADVTCRLYPDLGHTINEDEILFARTMLDRLT
jgi:predicted esterase